MEKEELQSLFKKYHEGTCTEQEKAKLEAWYLEYNEQETGLSPKKIKATGSRIFRELPGNHTTFIPIGIKLAIAAIMLGLAITVVLEWVLPKEKPVVAYYTHDIKPGGNRGILTLSDGRKIKLDSAAIGQIAAQSGLQILKTGSGQIIYKTAAGNAINNAPVTNNVSTPIGGQWQVALPDGTKVWLNAVSSLTYPVTFRSQRTRIVQLSGEAYFEVAKDKAHPFIVQTDKQSVEVLGTHFNVNAYPDDPSTKTTLAEGSVKVSDHHSRTRLLSPGQQAVLAADNLSVNAANLEQTLAWKNGQFRFKDEDIQSIMRQLARWYNIEVHYDTGFSQEGLNGKISRFKNISQVLEALEATKTVHFKVEGRRVTVMK